MKEEAVARIEEVRDVSTQRDVGVILVDNIEIGRVKDGEVVINKSLSRKQYEETMREDQEYYGLGMPITTVEGKIKGAKKTAALTKRVDLICRLAEKLSVLKATGDVKGMLELADEYEAAGMKRAANIIRQEVG